MGFSILSTFSLAVVLLLASGPGLSCESQDYSPACQEEYRNVAKLLISMEKKDQDVFTDPNVDEDEREILVAENTRELKKIVEAIGWPTKNKVGEKASSAAWLIAQHTHDRDFREKTLTLLGRSVALGHAAPDEYAYLIDRYLVRNGKPQIFGTQAKPIMEWKSDEPEFEPIANPEYIDYLRAAVGLHSFGFYKVKLKEVGKVIRSGGDRKQVKAALGAD